MFYRCSSLVSIPDLSKWNINNAYDMNSFLEDFSSIISLPNIFNLKVENKSIINIVKHIIIPLDSVDLPILEGGGINAE